MKKRKKQVRIATELSQQPWGRSKKQAKYEHETRKLKNRIFELEQALGVMTHGGDGKALVLFTSSAVITTLGALARTGFHGDTPAKVAEQLLREAVLDESQHPQTMHLLLRPYLQDATRG